MRLSAHPDAYLNNPLLVFHGVHNVNTGEVLPRFKSFAKYKGWDFRAHGGMGEWVRIEAAGSIHTFYNNGEHNYDDLTRIHLAEAIALLKTDLGIDPIYDDLNNIEFGVNIDLNFKVQIVLDSLLSYRGSSFERPIENPRFYECRKKQFIIKIYDKGAQFQLPSNTLRIEIKVLKMEFLRTKGIYIKHLSDLLLLENCQKLGELLYAIFNQILFCDHSINAEDLNQREEILYLRGCLTRSWKRPVRSNCDSATEYTRVRIAHKRREDEFRRLFTPVFIPVIKQHLTLKWAALSQTTVDDDKRIEELMASWSHPMVEFDPKQRSDVSN